MTHRIDFGGHVYEFTSAARAREFALSHRLLFGDRMRVTRIRN